MTYSENVTLEQYAVLVVAEEEGYIVDILDEYGMRLRWAITGTTRTSSNLTEDAKRRLIPRFRQVVLDLIHNGTIAVREPVGGNWDDAPDLSASEIESALGDESAWIKRSDGSARMLMILIEG